MGGRPGTSASATPASTSTIEGAVLSRRAIRAAATSTARRTSRIWMVAVIADRHARRWPRPQPLLAAELRRQISRDGVGLFWRCGRAACHHVGDDRRPVLARPLDHGDALEIVADHAAR